MRCPSLDEVVKGLRGRSLSFEALAYKCGRDGALRLVAAAALKMRLEGELGSVVCLHARPLWICGTRGLQTFCLPRYAARDAVKKALAVAENVGIRPFWIAPLKKRHNLCWAKEDAEKLVAALLDGLKPAKGRRRARRDMRRFVPEEDIGE